MALININILGRPNSPPTISDIKTTWVNRVTRPITLDDFMNLGNYQDAEGDSLGRVKIDLVPTQGSLITGANGTIVQSGQEILIADILAGNFKYIPLDQDLASTGDFRFRVSDSVDPTNYSAQKFFTIDNPVPQMLGVLTATHGDLHASQSTGKDLILNWNITTNLNNYSDINLGSLRTYNPIIWDFSVANKIVIESMSDEVYVTNQSFPNFWNNYVVWNNPNGFNQKQILDSSTGNPITLPYTVNLPNGNTPITNIGLKIRFAPNELIVPATFNTVYSNYNTGLRVIKVKYKIYSNNIPQTPTLTTMWLDGTVQN